MRKIGKEKERQEERSGKVRGLPEPPDIVIPVCLGEFGVRQAQAIRKLWERTWSQDARAGKEHKK